MLALGEGLQHIQAEQEYMKMRERIHRNSEPVHATPMLDAACPHLHHNASRPRPETSVFMITCMRLAVLPHTYPSPPFLRFPPFHFFYPPSFSLPPLNLDSDEQPLNRPIRGSYGGQLSKP